MDGRSSSIGRGSDPWDEGASSKFGGWWGGSTSSLGNRVSIYWGARLEAITHYVGESHSPRIEIEDGVIIGQNLHCTCSRSVRIGRNTAITANVTITDTNHSYEDISIPIKDSPLLADPVEIGPDCHRPQQRRDPARDSDRPPLGGGGEQRREGEVRGLLRPCGLPGTDGPAAGSGPERMDPGSGGVDEMTGNRREVRRA